ncbi:hypothetical protein Plec18170_005899 [Paecilomyces lecythidis]
MPEGIDIEKCKRLSSIHGLGKKEIENAQLQRLQQRLYEQHQQLQLQQQLENSCSRNKAD